MADPIPVLGTDAERQQDRFARYSFEMVAIGLCAAAGLVLAWWAASALFLIFAGLLFGAVLDACARGLGHFWDVARRWRLATAIAGLACILVASLSFGGYQIAQQADDLIATVQTQLRSLRGELNQRGIGTPSPKTRSGQEGGQEPTTPTQGTDADTSSSGQGGHGQFGRTFLPDPTALMQSATTAVSAVLGALGNFVVVVFLGLYVALDPDLYRHGALLLLPRDKRARMGAVLDEAAGTLRWWIIGQLVSMAAVATLSLIGLLIIGMPGAMILSVQAGLFAFIPYVGVIVGGGVIVLAALSQGGSMVLWALGVYAVVQLAESYVITPLVQRRTVDLPPALTIAGLVLLGALFGVWGLALGAPLVASFRLIVLRLWVEDALGGASSRGPAT